MKKILNVSFVLLVSICLLTGCGNKKTNTNNNNGNSQNNNTQIDNNQNDNEINNNEKIDLSFSNEKFEVNDNTLTLLTKVTNITEVVGKNINVKIILVNEDKEVTSFIETIEEIKPNESITIESIYNSYSDNVKTINYEIVRD